MKTKLTEIADKEREKLITKNTYNSKREYSSSHKNALSDGDEKGMGENGGSIGTSIDIKTRKELTLMNKYSEKNEYKNIE